MPSSPNRKRFLFALAAIAGLVACAFVLVLIILLIMGHIANSARLPEALKRPPALPPEFSALAHSSAPAMRPVTLTAGELARIKSDQDYLRLRLARDPSLLSITLFLQTLQRYLDEDIKDSVDKLGVTVYDHEISPEENAWLKAHQDFIAQLHRLAQADPIPSPSLEELAVIFRVNASYRSEASFFLMRATQILARNALLQMKAQDFKASSQCLRDALRLGENLSGRLGLIQQISNLVNLSIVAASLQTCIENPRFPVSELKLLASDLERVDKTQYQPGLMAHAYYEEYLLKRYRIIDAMDHSTWADPEFNPDKWSKDSTNYYDYFIHLPGHRKLMVPRIDRHLLDGLRAMYNRRHAAEALQQADHFYTQELAAVMPVAEGQASVMAEPSVTTAARNFILGRSVIEIHKNLGDRLTQELMSYTSLRLVRLGIAWRIDPKATHARRGEDFRNDLFHPWRDPFTGKPFLVDTASTTTLIYSPGPDRRDQHGSDFSDDIAIRIPGL